MTRQELAEKNARCNHAVGDRVQHVGIPSWSGRVKKVMKSNRGEQAGVEVSGFRGVWEPGLWDRV